ncbi:activating transcription factor 7-interacting protein 1 isoform X4 [Octopus bimaculoides]|uniref:activating transcription factor 7-interacting protein 1 isoform X4 n=1 Tax=Octopus bimaculoides TaxID=37653 RepID=UPI0022DEC341|nr:activating transcription factor 7-interacting protein 1 isoform X4 [Octopus bimaculoides]
MPNRKRSMLCSKRNALLKQRKRELRSQVRMSAVEKVATTAAFSSSNTIGQSNSARMSSTKLSPLHVSLNANPNLVEHSGFSDNNSDGNSEFEEALKNIKALNGQGRYTDTPENEAIEKNVDSNFGIKPDKKSSSTTNINKNTSESQKQSDDQNLDESVSQENVNNNSSHMNLSPIDTTQTSPLSENYDNPENLDDVKNNCDKSKTSKNEASDNEETEVNFNHLNSLNVSSDKKNCNDNENHSEKKNFVGNGDYSGSDVKEFVSSYGLDEKIKDSFKYFSEKNSNSALSKMLLKKKDDSNVQNVTSTSDSQSSSKSNKTSSSRGNLFENFGTIASTNHNDDKEDEKIKEIDEYISKSNGQVDSSVSAPLQPEEPDKDISTSDKDDTEISKDVSNSDEKEEADLDNDNGKEVDSSSERLSKTPSPLQFSRNNSNEDLSSVTKSCEISESWENNDKKRSAEEADDWTDAEIAPVKRSRLDDVIGNLGSRIGIKLDSIPFVDELEESSKDSDSSEKPSEESVTTDEEEDQEKTSNSDQKYIKISEKELAEIVKREVINILNSKETTLESLQVKIDELQATNEYWKTQAKELHKEVLELTVLQQKQEKRKAAAIALKAITARHVAVQVDEGKTSQTPSSTKTVKITTQKKSIQSPSSLSFSSSSSSSLSAPVAVSANLGISENSSSHWSRAITTQDTIQSNLVAQPTVTSGLLSNNTTPLAVFKKKIVPPNNSNNNNNQSKNGQVSSQLTTPVTKYQSTTVKSLLDASRNTNQVSTPQTLLYQSSGLIVVSPPTATATTAANTTTTTRSILTKPVTSQAPSGAVKLIDLTGDDEAPFKNQANGKNVVHTAAIAPMGSVRSNIVSQQVVRQVTPVQQPKVPFGTSFLLSTPAGTQIISPSVTQGVGAAKPGVCQYVLTSTPNIRPGALVTVVPTTGTQNSSVRPPIVSSTVANAGSLPQLRPAQQSTAVASVDLTKAIRPPPPLQSAPVQQNTQRVVSTLLSTSSSTTPVAKHPAPLPSQPTPTVTSTGLKSPPPKAGLRISRVAQGIVLSWNMALNENHAEISNYQLYAYQEGSAPPSTSLWKKVGDIKALPLPMACTLTQFHEGNKYHFAVRAVDSHGRVGPFSDPSTINLGVGNK